MQNCISFKIFTFFHFWRHYLALSWMTINLTLTSFNISFIQLSFLHNFMYMIIFHKKYLLRLLMCKNISFEGQLYFTPFCYKYSPNQRPDCLKYIASTDFEGLNNKLILFSLYVVILLVFYKLLECCWINRNVQIFYTISTLQWYTKEGFRFI